MQPSDPVDPDDSVSQPGPHPGGQQRVWPAAPPRSDSPPTRNTPAWPASPPMAPPPQPWPITPVEDTPPPPEVDPAPTPPRSSRRWLVYTLTGLLAATLMIIAVAAGTNPTAPAPEAVDLDAAGCTPDTQQPDLGGGHLDEDASALAAQAPDVVYPDQPPASGPHIPRVVASGIYDVRIDPRITTHNMEHGYVVIWYDEGLAAADLTDLQAWSVRSLDGNFPKLVVARYPVDLPGGVDIAYTAWRQRQRCTGFDPAVADAFLANNYDLAGQAPEAGLPNHSAGQGGVIDPAGQDLLLPPLD